MNPFSIGPILEKYIPQYVNMFPKLHIYVIYMYICMYNICNYYTVMNLFGFPWWLTGKKYACHWMRPRFDPWFEKIL